jgi:serine/threonine protein kinase
VNPAEEAVVRHAIARGYIQQTHLAQARHEQAARQQRGEPADLLPLLAAFMSPPQVQELRQVYLSATQSGLRSSTVHPSQVGQVTQPGMAPPSPGSFSHLPPQPQSGSHARLHPSSAAGQIPLDSLPDEGEKTIQLDQMGPGGITLAPPGVGPPPLSVHLGSPAYPQPGTQPGGYPMGTQHPGAPPTGTVAVAPAYGPGPAGAFGSTSALGRGLSSPAARAGQLPVAGEQIGDYHLVRELARGGMGVVYEATDVNLGRRVALKLLLSQDLADDSVLVRRFLTEARELSNLSHPNIAGVYGASRDANGRHYMAMEFLEGEELKAQIVRDGSIEPRRAAEIVLKLARALGHAHGAGVLHRDIKPSNVIVTSADEPKLVDFGLARNVEDERERLTKTGEIMGTPAYMPPEQAGGEKARVGPLADVYSLGATLYHMLAGEPPFRGGSVMNLINKVLSEDPKPPSAHNDGIPGPLEAICLKAMEKDLEDRYESAEAFAEDLERFLGPRGEVSAKARGPVGRAIRWASRKGAVFMGGGLALVGVGVAVAAVMLVTTESPQPSPSPTAQGSPEPSRTRTPRPKRTTSLSINAASLPDLEGLQVRAGWGLQLIDQKIQLRSTRGRGPELTLPLVLKEPHFDLVVKAQVPYMTANAGVCFEFIKDHEVFHHGRPGPPQLRIEFGAQERTSAGSVEHGFSVNWAGAKGSLRRAKDAVACGYSEHPSAAPIPLEFTLEVRKEEFTLVWGERRKTFPAQLRLGRMVRLEVRPTPHRYYIKPGKKAGDRPQAFRSPRRFSRPPKLLSPELASVLFEEVRIQAPGHRSLLPSKETSEWSKIGSLERRGATREGLGSSLDKISALRGGSSSVAAENGLVRNEAGCYLAAAYAWLGQPEKGGDSLTGLYTANFGGAGLQREAPGPTMLFQGLSPLLDDKTLEPFVLGYRKYVLLDLPDSNPQAFLERGQKHFAARRPKARPLGLNTTLDALLSLLTAKRLGVEVPPLLLGKAWLEFGDPSRAETYLRPLAEAGDVEAMSYAGLAAYLLREFGQAELLWRRVQESESGSLPPKWQWAYDRAKRLAKSAK